MKGSKKTPVANLNRTLKLVSKESDFNYIEAYKTLRTNLDYILRKQKENSFDNADTPGGYAIAVTSSIPKEGKTNVAINMAVTFAQSKKKVLIIDCDLRKGTLKKYISVSGQTTGLTNYLTSRASNIHNYIVKNSEPGIDILYAGNLTDNPIEILESAKFTNLLETLKSEYDYIICDTPPVNVVSDILLISQKVDGIVYVVSHNYVKKTEVEIAKKQLETVNANILGTILNMYDSKDDTDHGYYNNYKYKYYGEN